MSSRFVVNLKIFFAHARSVDIYERVKSASVVFDHCAALRTQIERSKYHSWRESM